MIILEQSKTGIYTAKYNNKYIHSKYNPIEEGIRFVENNKHLLNNDVVIYGLGLGYHIEQLRNAMENQFIIYVFEWNLELVDLCLKINSDIFNKENIKIITAKDDMFYFKLNKSLKKVNDIIIHTPSLETIKESNENLYNIIKDYKAAKYSIEKNKDLLNENYESNKKVESEPIEKFINKFKHINKPYIVAAAGPSLDFELDLLKENEDKFIIFAVGTATRSLLKKNIRIDGIVIVDGDICIRDQLKKCKQIPLCFLSTASRWAVKDYVGPKYIFFNDKFADNIVIETGKTVAVATLSIAIKCGAKKVIFLGQDLAYLNGKSHTNGYKDIYNCEDKPVVNERCKLVKGFDGSMLETTSGYIYFKRQIEKIISNNKGISFINCSKGAFINGAKHISLKEYLHKKYLG